MTGDSSMTRPVTVQPDPINVIHDPNKMWLDIKGVLSELFCAVLRNITVHNHMDTDMSSRYR